MILTSFFLTRRFIKGARLKKILFVLFVLFVLSITAIGFSVYYYRDVIGYATRPAASESEEKIVSIPPGQSFRLISETLYQNGLITDPLKFKLYARIEGYDKHIKAGEYLLSPEMSPAEILEILKSGKVRLHKVTIPEGFSMTQIADTLASAGLVSRESFLAIANDPEFIRKYEIDAETLEGYLFPDTYFFPGKVTAEDIVMTMVQRFRSVFTPEMIQKAKQMGFTAHEIVTLASIIEKETGAAAERGLISSVFHNRLRKKMRLESDPTVIYGIEDFDGNITKKHLKTPTPYNTYTIKGLPPGPIANPGKASLEAALNPAPSEYIYFVSKNDGTHQFSKTLREHNNAVREYQLRKK